MRRFGFLSLIAGLAGSALVSSASADTVVIDGTISPGEYTGATVTKVVPGPNASPLGYAPDVNTYNVGFTSYLTSDASNVIVAIQSNGTAGALPYANLYFDTNPGTGSDVGFEVTNNDIFIPGGAGPFPILASDPQLHFATTTVGNVFTLEVAIPKLYFNSDPKGLGYPTGTSVQLRTVQAVDPGYAFTAGDISTGYSGPRFGTVDVSVTPTATPLPKPVYGTAFLLCIMGLCAYRRPTLFGLNPKVSM